MRHQDPSPRSASAGREPRARRRSSRLCFLNCCVSLRPPTLSGRLGAGTNWCLGRGWQSTDRRLLSPLASFRETSPVRFGLRVHLQSRGTRARLVLWERVLGAGGERKAEPEKRRGLTPGQAEVIFQHAAGLNAEAWTLTAPGFGAGGL